MITSKQLKKFDAQMDAAQGDAIFDVITPSGKRFGDCTKADISQIANAYERERARLARLARLQRPQRGAR